MQTIDKNASDVAPSRPDKTGRFHCPEPDCDANYAQRHNVLRHLQDVHGYLGDTAYRMKHGLPPGMGGRNGSSPKSSTDEPKGRAELRATVLGPLRTRMRNIDRRIEKLQGELGGLREERRDIDFVLKRLDPTSFVAPKNPSGTGGRSPDHEKKALIRRFIDEHAAELGDGFTQTSLHEKMVASGIAGVVSPLTIRAAIEEMRDAGLVRADKIVKGGGMQWALVGTNGAKAGEGDAEA